MMSDKIEKYMFVSLLKPFNRNTGTFSLEIATNHQKIPKSWPKSLRKLILGINYKHAVGGGSKNETSGVNK